MKKAICFLLLLINLVARAQQPVTFLVRNQTDQTPLEGVLVYTSIRNESKTTDSSGRCILSAPGNGFMDVSFSLIGYYRKKVKIILPIKSDNPYLVLLQPMEEEMEEVVIVSTRNNISDEINPRHVEVINEDEVEERSNDKPSDVSHVVREQPGVQVQRTSATAGTMNIRLQGLRGRYVQILKDGFPLFGGFASVISTNQIPPIDIKQVEVIKGPASTLYGGDAIAGVVNLISKSPDETPVYDLMLNAESAAAVDAGLYFSQRKNIFAYSLSGLYRYQKERDWNNDGYAETPKLQRFNLSPQFYFYVKENTEINAGINYTHEVRESGALTYLNGLRDSITGYFDQNKTDHVATNLKVQYSFSSNDRLTVRNAFNYFKRSVEIPNYLFRGIQLGSLTEFSYHGVRGKHDIVAGVDLRTDHFKELTDSTSAARNYNYITAGAFLQYIFNVTANTNLEGGIRIDYNQIYKIYALPHMAIRHKWNEVFSTKLNAGMGYKLPTIFQDESEEKAFERVLPINTSTKPELSLGGSLDLKVTSPNINGWRIGVHQLYFLTHIFKPIQAFSEVDTSCQSGDCNFLAYKNVNGFQQSKGIESGLNVSYRGFKTSLVYTLTDNTFRIDGVRSIAPLTSKHIVYLLAGYEIKNFSIDLDCYYFSAVKLTDGRTGQGIWEVGINTQLSFRHILLFANLENILDIRQTSFGPVVSTGLNPLRPTFADIYAPLEGPIFNLGFKLKLASFAKNTEDSGIEKLRNKD